MGATATRVGREVRGCRGLRVAAEELGGDVVAEAGGEAADLGDGAGEVRVPVRIVGRVDEPVVAELLDARLEQRLLGLEAEVALAALEQLAWVALHRGQQLGALLEVLVHPVDEVRHPARARLEERDPQRREPVEHAAHRERGERDHLVDRERQAVHLRVVVEPLRAREREVHAGRAVHGDGEVERRRTPRRTAAATGRRGSARRPPAGSSPRRRRGAPPASHLGDRPARRPAAAPSRHAFSRSGLWPHTLVEQPVVVRAGDVEREAGVVVRREADDQPAEQHLHVDALGVHVGQPLVEVGRAGRARGARSPTSIGTPRPGALLRRVELVADLRHPLVARPAAPTANPDAAPRARSTRRVLVHVRVRVDTAATSTPRTNLTSRQVVCSTRDLRCHFRSTSTASVHGFGQLRVPRAEHVRSRRRDEGHRRSTRPATRTTRSGSPSTAARRWRCRSTSNRRRVSLGLSDDHVALHDTARRWVGEPLPAVGASCARSTPSRETMPPFWDELAGARLARAAPARGRRRLRLRPGRARGRARGARPRLCARDRSCPRCSPRRSIDRLGDDDARRCAPSRRSPTDPSPPRSRSPVPARRCSVRRWPTLVARARDGRLERRARRRRCTITPRASVDETRRVADVDAADAAPIAFLADPDGATVTDLALILHRGRVRGRRGVVRRDGGGVRAGARAVRPADRSVPRREAPVRRHAAARSSRRAPSRGTRRGPRRPPTNGSLAASVAGALAPAAFFQCAKDCVQVLGGIGFTWEHDAHLYLKRATALRSLTGGGPHRWRRRTLELARRGARRTLAVDLPPRRSRSADEIRADPRRPDARTTRASGARLLADRGYLAPHWPKPWGRDASPVEQLVIDDEMHAAHVRRPHLQVGAWVLPTLDRARHRRAAATVDPVDAAGRDHVVPALQRAGRGQRPRVA